MAAQPVIWYYPDPAGSVEKLAFGVGEQLTDLPDIPRRVVDEEEGLSGIPHLVALQGGLDVGILLENFDDEDLAHDLKSFEAHLARGGFFTLAEDEDRAFGAWCTKPPQRNDTTLEHGGHVYHGAPSLSAGDWLCLEGPLPEGNREWVKVDSTSGNVITLDAATPVRYTYGSPSVLIRERGFFPVLRWPASARQGPIITSFFRITWTLDFLARMDWGTLVATASTSGSPVFRTTDQIALPTLDEVVRRGALASKLSTGNPATTRRYSG